MHPLLQLAMAQPGLLGEHAQAYAALLGSELGTLQQRTRQSLLWSLATLACGITALVLAGVALMLWAALPGLASSSNAWLLWATPALPLLATLGCWLQLRQSGATPAFAAFKQQLQADLQLLQEVGAP
ncbi:MAG: hypothetical protein HXX19_13110 [Rhodoferax sp.]|nr:hypothetical protein [Rhodoferax sp.]